MNQSVWDSIAQAATNVGASVADTINAVRFGIPYNAAANTYPQQQVVYGQAPTPGTSGLFLLIIAGMAFFLLRK